MKKILLSFALCLAVMSAMAQKQTKTYTYDGFTGVSVSHSFQVTVQKSDVFSIEVSVEKDYLPYLDVRKNDDVLHIGFTADLPRKLRTKSSKIASARISMPVLSAVSLSGSADMKCEGSFSSGMRGIDIYLSGASSLKGYSVSGTEVDIELSGSSLVDCEIVADKVDANVSGASRVNVSGTAETLKAQISGASALLASSFSVKEASVEASGASKVRVAPVNELKVSLSGASSCTYEANETLKINARSITGASSLKPASK